MATINSRRERTVNLACYDDSSYKILTDLQPHEALAELEAVVTRFRKQVEDMQTSEDLDDKDGDRDDEQPAGVTVTTLGSSQGQI